MAIIQKILFPVDFSRAGAVAAPFIAKFAAAYSARVTLLHVIEPFNISASELVVRPFPDAEADHERRAAERLKAFLAEDFPAGQHSRLIAAGDPANQIASIAREQKFDLIAIPTYSGGLFRRTLLGSTTAKVLNDADCPVLTPQHSETVTQRPGEHHEIACSIRLDAEGIRILGYAGQLAEASGSRLSIIHVIPGGNPGLTSLFDETWQEHSPEAEDARRRLAELQRSAGTQAEVRIATGGIKQAIIESTVRLKTDLLVIGRSPESGAIGRMRDLTYALVRDSICPVLSL